MNKLVEWLKHMVSRNGTKVEEKEQDDSVTKKNVKSVSQTMKIRTENLIKRMESVVDQMDCIDGG